MQINYDNKADTKYIRIKKGKIVKTNKEKDWLLFDYAKNGDVLGIEILDASKNRVSFSVMKDKLIGLCIIKEKILGTKKDNNKDELELTIDSPEYEKESQFVSV